MASRHNWGHLLSCNRSPRLAKRWAAFAFALSTLLAGPTLATAENDEFDLDDARITLGVDVGAAVSGGDFYSFGAGKAYVFALQYGQWRLDWRLAESYDLTQEADLGATVDGEFASHTMSVARVLPFTMRPTIGLGAALVSSSAPTIASDGRVTAVERSGVGLVASAEVSHTVAETFDIVFGVRAYFVKWEEVSGSVIYEADSTSFKEGVEPDLSPPMSASLGIRVIWD